MADDCNSLEDFRHESMQDVETVLSYLDAVREGIRSGKLQLSAAGQIMELEPKGLVKCDIQAKCRAGRCKLALKFSWRDERSAADSQPLVIEAGETA